MENNKYIVYKHTCLDNGKVYIGMTGTPFLIRTGNNGEGYLHKKKNGDWVQPQMARAILKHGWDNFSHEILFENLSKEEADAKEKELIELYDSRNPQKGYNTRTGGSNGPLSEEAKEKLRETMRGRYDGENNPFYGKTHSQETKDLIGAKNKMYASQRDISGENNPMWGRKLTEEERKKCGDAMLGKKHSDETKKKMSEAAKKSWASGKRKKKKEATKETREKLSAVLKGKKRTVEQKKRIGEAHAPYIYICVETGEEFVSSAEAGRQKGIDKTCIQNVVNGKQKTAGGYHWIKRDKIQEALE